MTNVKPSAIPEKSLLDVSLHHQHDDVLHHMQLLAFHGLYEHTYEGSVFRHWYNEACEHQRIRPGMCLCIVWDQGEPIAVANFDPCWDQPVRSIPMYMLKNGMNRNSKIQLHINKAFQWMGRVSIYTKPEYRNQGIARMAAQELLRMVEIQHPIKTDHVPMYWGESRALKSFGLHDTNIHRYHMPHDIYASNSKLVLNREAYRFINSVLEKKHHRKDLQSYTITRATEKDNTWKPYTRECSQSTIVENEHV